MNLLNETINIIKINSVTQTGNVKIVQYLSNLLNKYQLPVEIQKVNYQGVDQENLICRIEGSSSEEVIFNTHLDTVHPGDNKKWHKTQCDPFNPVIEGDKIYGIGSADTKLDFLCKLKALLKYKNHHFKNPLVFIGTFGEEMGLIGCEYFLKANYLQNPKYAFVGEPTHLNLVYAHKGMVVLKLEFPFDNYTDESNKEHLEFIGESAHGSTPHLGVNAIKKGIEALKKLPQNKEVIHIVGGLIFNIVPTEAKITITPKTTCPNKNKLIEIFNFFDNIEKELYNHEDSDYDPPCSVLNIGRIEIKDSKLCIQMAFRMLPKRNFNAILNGINTFIEPLGGSLIIERDLPPMNTNRDNLIIKKSHKILNDLNIPSKLETKPALTEASLYEQWGVRSVVFGPGLAKGNIHKPNEYNLLSQLDQATLFYEKVIEAFCLAT